MSRRATLIALSAGAVAALLIASGVTFTAASLPSGAGFREQHWSGGSTCEPAGRAASSKRVVREPFVEEGIHPRGCTRWTSHLVVLRRAQLELEIESEGDGQVWIGDELVVGDTGEHARQTKRGTIELSPGVHRVRVEHVQAGTAFFRMWAHDLRGPHSPWEPQVLTSERFYVHAGDALQELADPHERSPSLSLLVFASLVIAALLLWLALLVARGRAPPWVDVALSALVGLVALVVRVRGIPAQGITWDERFYSIAGEHHVRNLILGDWSHNSWRWNAEHPPISKWIYGLGGVIGGPDGARMASVVMSSVAVAFVYSFCRMFWPRSVSVGAAIIAGLMPPLVAFGRLSGLESPVIFFWTASLLAAAVWLRREPLQGRQLIFLSAPFWVAALAVFGVASRMTLVWLIPLLAVILLYGRRSQLRRGSLSVPTASLAGLVFALGIVCLAWPWMWDDPVEMWRAMLSRWGSQHTTEFYLGELQRPPPPEFYAAAFLATTPLLLLLLAVVGAGVGLRRRDWRPGTIVTLLWLVVPFSQSISSFRQDLARYVVQSWLAVAILAALPAAALAPKIRAWIQDRARVKTEGRARFAAAASFAPMAVVVVYTGVALALVEPYPLDYFNEAVGGPAGVSESRMFEMQWWGEGVREAVEYVNESADAGATVRLSPGLGIWVARLRDDLEAVGGRADYVVIGHHKYLAGSPIGCEIVRRVTVRGAPLVDVYRCGGAASDGDD